MLLVVEESVPEAQMRPRVPDRAPGGGREGGGGSDVFDFLNKKRICDAMRCRLRSGCFPPRVAAAGGRTYRVLK